MCNFQGYFSRTFQDQSAFSRTFQVQEFQEKIQDFPGISRRRGNPV